MTYEALLRLYNSKDLLDEFQTLVSAGYDLKTPDGFLQISLMKAEILRRMKGAEE